MGLDIYSFKEEFPLKCKTMVKTIEKEDVEKKNASEAERIIAETMAECWALYDKGDSKAFPSEFFKTSSCVPCARIHLTEEAKEYMRQNDVDISIRNSMDEKMKGQEYTYYNYLMNAGDKFLAFNFGNGMPFNLSGGAFEVLDETWFWHAAKLTNKIDGSSYDAKMSSVNVSLPELFEYGKGDLLINYGIVTVSEEGFGDYIPYLFYFQTNQENNPFDEAKHGLIFNDNKLIAEVGAALGIGGLFFVSAPVSLRAAFTLAAPIAAASSDYEVSDIVDLDVNFCDSWEGIPA
jgi:hypothetical protein